MTLAAQATAALTGSLTLITGAQAARYGAGKLDRSALANFLK